jgi:hypothetical protein
MRTRPRRTGLSSRRGQRTAESASPATTRFAHIPTSPPIRTGAGRRPSALRPTRSSAMGRERKVANAIARREARGGSRVKAIPVLN